jgi:hypothetical protein
MLFIHFFFVEQWWHLFLFIFSLLNSGNIYLCQNFVSTCPPSLGEISLCTVVVQNSFIQLSLFRDLYICPLKCCLVHCLLSFVVSFYLLFSSVWKWIPHLIWQIYAYHIKNLFSENCNSYFYALVLILQVHLDKNIS